MDSVIIGDKYFEHLIESKIKQRRHTAKFLRLDLYIGAAFGGIVTSEGLGLGFALGLDSNRDDWI